MRRDWRACYLFISTVVIQKYVIGGCKNDNNVCDGDKLTERAGGLPGCRSEKL